MCDKMKLIEILTPDFTFSDDSTGSVFIITNVNTTIPQLKNTLIQELMIQNMYLSQKEDIIK